MFKKRTSLPKNLEIGLSWFLGKMVFLGLFPMILNHGKHLIYFSNILQVYPGSSLYNSNRKPTFCSPFRFTFQYHTMPDFSSVCLPLSPHLYFFIYLLNEVRGMENYLFSPLSIFPFSPFLHCLLTISLFSPLPSTSIYGMKNHSLPTSLVSPWNGKLPLLISSHLFNIPPSLYFSPTPSLVLLF